MDRHGTRNYVTLTHVLHDDAVVLTRMMVSCYSRICAIARARSRKVSYTGVYLFLGLVILLFVSLTKASNVLEGLDGTVVKLYAVESWQKQYDEL